MSVVGGCGSQLPHSWNRNGLQGRCPARSGLYRIADRRTQCYGNNGVRSRARLPPLSPLSSTVLARRTPDGMSVRGRGAGSKRANPRA